MERLSFFIPILAFSLGCSGLQTLQENVDPGPMPELQSHPLPARPVASLEQIQKEPLTLAYSLDFRSLDNPEIQRILEQKIHGWLRSINVRGAQLPTFRIGPEEAAPASYPYLIRFVVRPEEDHHRLDASLQHSGSGRKYPDFSRNFQIDPGGQGDGLALFRSMDLFLSDGRVPSISFPASTGKELKDWISLTGTGRIRILSSAEASVQIRDKTGSVAHTGLTPLQVDLPAGAYEFRIKRKGMETRVETRILRPAEADIVLLTWPDDESSGSLSVLTSPADLQVAVDGTVQGNSPIAIPALVSGDVELEIARKEEDTGEAFVLKRSQVSIGEAEDITRFFSFDYYIDFQRKQEPGSFWRSNRSLSSIKLTGQGIELKAVQAQQGLPPGLLSQPLVAMDHKIRISLVPGSDLLFGLSSGNGGDRPRLELKGDQLSFHPPASGQDASPGSYVRPRAGEGQLDVLEIYYKEEDSSLRLSLNGSRIYSGPFKNSGYFQIYLGGTGNTVPVQEVEVRAGPMVGHSILEWTGTLFFDLGRSLGFSPRLRSVNETSEN